MLAGIDVSINNGGNCNFSQFEKPWNGKGAWMETENCF